MFWQLVALAVFITYIIGCRIIAPRDKVKAIEHAPSCPLENGGNRERSSAAYHGWH